MEVSLLKKGVNGLTEVVPNYAVFSTIYYLEEGIETETFV